MPELLQIRSGRAPTAQEPELSVLERSVDLNNWFDTTTRTTKVRHTWVFQPLILVSDAYSSDWLDFLKKHLSPGAALTPSANTWANRALT